MADEQRCDDDFFCGDCPDCLTGEHPENRQRYDREPTREAEGREDDGE